MGIGEWWLRSISLKDSEGRSADVIFFSAEGKMLYRIFTNDKGLRMGTETEKEPNALPEVARAHLTDTYKGKKIRAVLQQSDAQDNITGYRVILNDVELFYDSKGKLQ